MAGTEIHTSEDGKKRKSIPENGGKTQQTEQNTTKKKNQTKQPKKKQKLFNRYSAVFNIEQPMLSAAVCSTKHTVWKSLY